MPKPKKAKLGPMADMLSGFKNDLEKEAAWEKAERYLNRFRPRDKFRLIEQGLIRNDPGFTPLVKDKDGNWKIGS